MSLCLEILRQGGIQVECEVGDNVAVHSQPPLAKTMLHQIRYESGTPEN